MNPDRFFNACDATQMQTGSLRAICGVRVRPLTHEEAAAVLKADSTRGAYDRRNPGVCVVCGLPASSPQSIYCVECR